MLVIGIDPHKATHTAVAVETATHTITDELTFDASPEGYQAFDTWLGAHPFEQIGIEGARGLGRNLADRLLAGHQAVLDVPPKEVRRNRIRRKGGTDKNDRADAYATALALIAGLGDPIPTGTCAQTAALLSTERDWLNRDRTATRNRLHALVRDLVPGGMDRGLAPARISNLLKGLRATDPATAQRKAMCRSLLADLRRLDRALNINQQRMHDLLATTGTSLTAIDGIATISACTILAAIGDIDRFQTEAHLAAFAGTAPRQIASAGSSRHRLNRGGNRRLRHALHTAALTQARLNTNPGRAYYQRKRDEGKTHREALRCLKRQIIKAIWRTMQHDAENQPATT